MHATFHLHRRSPHLGPALPWVAPSPAAPAKVRPAEADIHLDVTTWLLLATAVLIAAGAGAVGALVWRSAIPAVPPSILGGADSGASSASVPAVPHSTTPAPPPAAASIRAIDPGAATYPTSVCPDAFRPPGEALALVDGRFGAEWGRERASGGPAIGVRYDSVSYGDLTGDGQDEAAVTLTCFLAQSDGFQSVVAVLGMWEGELVTLASLQRSGTTSTDADGHPLGEAVTSVVISGEQLIVGWCRSAPLGQPEVPDRDVTVGYRLDGDVLRVESAPVAVAPVGGSPGRRPPATL